MCAIKKGVTGKMKGYVLSWVNRKQFIHYLLCIFLFFQLDYTEAGTCNICFEKRKNVSNAAQLCTCKVVFNIEKAFKVRWTKAVEIQLTCLKSSERSQVDHGFRLFWTLFQNIQYTKCLFLMFNILFFRLSNFKSKTDQLSKFQHFFVQLF